MPIASLYDLNECFMTSTTLPFPESFLHYLWRLRLFDHTHLTTTDGTPLRIIDPGTHNLHDAGPDFSQARIQLGETLWAGNIELHKRSSDWLQHGHQTDPAYQTVVLHVVYEDDRPLFRPSGEAMPTLVLRGRVASRHLYRYAQLMSSQQWIPCQSQLSRQVWPACTDWLPYLTKERLACKAIAIEEALEQTNHHWEAVFYYFLARNFGLPQNAMAFEALARATPLKVVAHYKTNVQQLEALFLGQAGLLQLEVEPDGYTQVLQQEYQFLAHKHRLQPISVRAWKRGGMRPAHFPTLRIAQFAALIHQAQRLFGAMLQTTDTVALQQLFAVEAGRYWRTHYRLGKPGKPRKKLLGKRTIHSLLINTVAPFLVAYGRHKGDPAYKDRALALLRELPPEQNRIIEEWRDLGVKLSGADQSQALLQLKKHYCEHKRCLECQIGHHILDRRDFGRSQDKKHLHVVRIE